MVMLWRIECRVRAWRLDGELVIDKETGRYFDSHFIRYWETFNCTDARYSNAIFRAAGLENFSNDHN